MLWKFAVLWSLTFYYYLGDWTFVREKISETNSTKLNFPKKDIGTSFVCFAENYDSDIPPFIALNISCL